MQMKFKEPLRLQLEKKYTHIFIIFQSSPDILTDKLCSWSELNYELNWVKLAMSANRTSPNETTLQDTHFKSVLEVGVALSIFGAQIMNIFNLYSK